MKTYRYYSDSTKLASKDLSQLIGVSRQTVWRWQHQGMPSHRTQRGRHFVLDEVLSWMKEQPKLMELYVLTKIKLDFN